MIKDDEDILLPPMREELSLHPGPCSIHGAPTWTIYDPSSYRFYRLGWLETEIISRWSLGSAKKIIEEIENQTTLKPLIDDVIRVVEFVNAAGMVKCSTINDTKRLIHTKNKNKKSVALWLLSNYLFFRVPLLNPDKILEKIFPFVKWMFTKKFLFIVFLTSLIGIYLIIRQWTFFKHGAGDLLTPEGGIIAVLSLIFLKIIHEFGHAFAAKKHGCRVPSMGVAFMVFYPVLWTDTTDTWKLRNKYKRLEVVWSGLLSELAIASIASVLWFIWPDGLIKTGLLIMASVGWIMSLAINANPFMRYDGYYLLSDFLEAPDLQVRSFALAKWRLREFLFGFGDPRPYIEERSREWFLILYAYCTWFYRFFLFWGIALAVYSLFFKLLGIFLMSVELLWFLVRPIYGEILFWVKRAKEFSEFKIPFRLLFIIALFLFFILFPWKKNIIVPGIITSSNKMVVYSKSSGRLKDVMVKNNQHVKKDEILWVIESPSLDKEITQLKLKLSEIEYRLKIDSIYTNFARFMQSDLKESERLNLKLQELLRKKKELFVKAPSSGIITDIAKWVKPGTWLAQAVPMGIIKKGEAVVFIYINEVDLPLLDIGFKGFFYFLNGFNKPMEIEIKNIDTSYVSDLKYPQLASSFGGPIGVFEKNIDKLKLVPEKTIYKVRCRVINHANPPGNTFPGRVSINGKGRSLIVKISEKLAGIFIRESGF